MARTDYGPEIKSSMGNSVGRKAPPGKRMPSANAPAKKVAPTGGPDISAEMAQDKQRGIAQGSPQDIAMDARPPTAGAQLPHPPAPGGGNPAHAMMAASIAHAILGSTKGGY